jgi:hypothetical protein
MMKDDRLAEFKNHMKEEFAKLPKNLSVEEYNDRSERCLSLSENFRHEGDLYKTKKYELLSKKYKQMGLEKQHPELFKKETPGIPAQAIIEEIPAEKVEEKKSLWKRFIGFFSKKEVKIEVKQDNLQ